MAPHGNTDPTRGPEINELPATNDKTGSNRATKAEVEARLAAVRRWVRTEGVTVEEAVRRLQDAHGISRRQALRYWVRGYRPLLSEEDRRGSSHPRDRRGRYRPWHSLSSYADKP